MPRPRSIIVRSTSSTASGSSATICRVASIAARNDGNWQMPSTLRGLIGCRISSIAAEKASVPSEPTSSRARLSRPAAARRRRQRIDVVAADPAQHFRESARRSSAASVAPIARSRPISSAMPFGVVAPCPGQSGPKRKPRAVGQNRVDGRDIVGHQPVADRLAAAGIVGRHAADGAARMRRGIDRKEQAMRLERRVEMAEHDARLDHGAAPLRDRSRARCADISSSR